MISKHQSKQSLFLTIITILICGLMILTPLLFSSITRSVFEVHKLLALRVISLLIFGLWTTKSILDYSKKPSTSPKKYTWKTLLTHIEIPLVLWVVFNILSTVFSQNIYISIIGAYDRWEGIITVTNYAFLFYYISKLVKEHWQLKWIMLATIMPIVLSAIYGIFQSLNIDFMQWSVDPSRRVFACINNPVHFCAYVGMALPFGIAWMLYLSEKKIETPVYKTAINWTLATSSALLLVITTVIQYGKHFSELVALMLPTLGAPEVISPILVTFLSITFIATIPYFIQKISTLPALASIKSLPLILSSSLIQLGVLISLHTIARITAPDTSVGLVWLVGIPLIALTTYAQTSTLSLTKTKHIIPIAFISITSLLSLYIPINTLAISLLSILGWLIIYPSTTLFPQKTHPPYWATYTLLLMVVTTFVDIQKTDLFILIAHLSLYYTFAPLPNWHHVVKRGFFVLLTIIFYAQFISFARATWLGFIAAMPLFYILATHTYDTRNIKEFLIDIALTLATIAALILTIIFQYHHKSIWIATAIFAVIGLGIANTLRVALHQTSQTLTLPTFGKIILAGILLILTFTIDLKTLPYHLYLVLYPILFALFLYICKKSNAFEASLLTRFILILLFLKLQFISLNLTNIVIYIILIAGYAITTRRFTPQKTEKDNWLLAFLIMFGLIVSAPTIPYHINTFFPSKTTQEITAISNAQTRVQIYAKDALTGTARTSMWKSSFPWIKDYWFIGSGLDTIKYMYPQYRRPEYGILEGGHNFTPDRLHNEYLNTFATKGLIGGLLYYVGVIGLVFLIVLRRIYLTSTHPINYIRAGLLAGAGIYLCQVLFNFGVVATLVLFYVLLGLALATSRKEFETHDPT